MTARDLLAEWDRLQREQRWPDVERLRAAFRLALDVETAAALLAGRPVDRDRIDRRGLAWARQERLVELRQPVDHFRAAA